MTTHKQNTDLEATLRLALEALDDIKDDCSGCEFEWSNDYPLQAKAHAAIKAALEAHKQSTTCGEPVANVVLRDGLPTLLRESDIKPTDERLYTTPPYVATPLPQRPSRSDMTWVDLTDEQMWNAYTGGSDIINLDYAKSIVALFKEKNTHE